MREIERKIEVFLLKNKNKMGIRKRVGKKIGYIELNSSS